LASASVNQRPSALPSSSAASSPASSAAIASATLRAARRRGGGAAGRRGGGAAGIPPQPPGKRDQRHCRDPHREGPKKGHEQRQSESQQGSPQDRGGDRHPIPVSKELPHQQRLGTMISTRLFCDLPAASALEAIDTVSPRPLVVPDDGSDRSSLINAAMVPALAALRAMLSGKRTVAIGVLSVWRRRPPHCPARSRSRSRSGGAAPRGPAQLRARLDGGRRCNWAGYADCRCRPFSNDRQASPTAVAPKSTSGDCPGPEPVAKSDQWAASPGSILRSGRACVAQYPLIKARWSGICCTCRESCWSSPSKELRRACGLSIPDMR